MKNPPHPGGLVGDSLDELGVSVADAAKALGVSRQQLHNIIAGRSAISATMAMKLERAIGSTAQTWLRMQAAYDLAHVDPHEIEQVEQRGLDWRHRDRRGEITRKHRNTLVGTLRKVYGREFAPGCSDDDTLADALATMHERSLSKLVHDQHSGELDDKIAKAEGRRKEARAAVSPPLRRARA